MILAGFKTAYITELFQFSYVSILFEMFKNDFVINVAQERFFMRAYFEEHMSIF